MSDERVLPKLNLSWQQSFSANRNSHSENGHKEAHQYLRRAPSQGAERRLGRLRLKALSLADSTWINPNIPTKADEIFAQLPETEADRRNFAEMCSNVSWGMSLLAVHSYVPRTVFYWNHQTLEIVRTTGQQRQKARRISYCNEEEHCMYFDCSLKHLNYQWIWHDYTSLNLVCDASGGARDELCSRFWTRIPPCPCRLRYKTAATEGN